jgi:hypothetical protein
MSRVEGGQSVRVTFPLRVRHGRPCYAWSAQRFGPMGTAFLDELGAPVRYSIGMLLTNRGAFAPAEFLVGNLEPAPHGTVSTIFQTLNRTETTES